MKAFVLCLILLASFQCFAAATESPRVTASGGLHDINKASTLLCLQVSNFSDEKLGKLADIVIDLSSSQIVYAVVAVGGFIGIGEKYIALPPSVLSAAPDGHSLFLDADKEALRRAPGFALSNAAELTNHSSVAAIYNFYHRNIELSSEANAGQLAANHHDETEKASGHEIREAAGSESPKKDLNFFKVTELIGMSVVDAKGRRVAVIRDLALDLKLQQAFYVVLSSGGFLGAGDRLYAAPCFAFSQTGDAKSLTFAMPVEAFNNAVPFQPNHWPRQYDEAFSIPSRAATAGRERITEPAGVPRGGTKPKAN